MSPRSVRSLGTTGNADAGSDRSWTSSQHARRSASFPYETTYDPPERGMKLMPGWHITLPPGHLMSRRPRTPMGRPDATRPQGQVGCGQVLQMARMPLIALPTTVHVPLQPSRQLHEIGPGLQPFRTHTPDSNAPPTRCEQICPGAHLIWPPSPVSQSVSLHGDPSRAHTLFLQ